MILVEWMDQRSEKYRGTHEHKLAVVSAWVHGSLVEH